MMQKSTVSLIERYQKSLQNIPSQIREDVNRHGGLSEDALLKLILHPQDHTIESPLEPNPGAVKIVCDKQTYECGHHTILDGKVAYCILAGGAGTRIGEPKALLKLPGLGMSLLTLKLFQSKGSGPIWIVTNDQTRDQIVDHVRSQVGLDQDRIKFINQYQSYRLTPDNQISFKENGEIDLYPCGHGDLFPALFHSGVLKEFNRAGGRYVSVVNVDNVLGSLDPLSVGRHVNCAAKVSCEVVEKTDEDSGGVLCDVHGSLQIVESFRINGVDPRTFRWLNTNTFIFNSDLELSSLGKLWNRVQKKSGDKLVIQHERLLQEITSVFETCYFKVERIDRFFPIKTMHDLKQASKRVSY